MVKKKLFSSKVENDLARPEDFINEIGKLTEKLTSDSVSEKEKAKVRLLANALIDEMANQIKLMCGIDADQIEKDVDTHLNNDSSFSIFNNGSLIKTYTKEEVDVIAVNKAFLEANGGSLKAYAENLISHGKQLPSSINVKTNTIYSFNSKGWQPGDPVGQSNAVIKITTK